MNNPEYTQQFVETFAEAELLGSKQRFDEALEKYEFLRQQMPDNVSVLNNIGQIYEKRGELEQAAKYYARCLELMPGQTVLLNNLANVYCRQEKWNDACPLLKQLVKTEFDFEKNAEKYALCLFNIQSKCETEAFISSVINQFPQNKLLNRLLGNSLLHLNRHREGLTRLKKGSGFIELNESGIRFLS